MQISNNFIALTKFEEPKQEGFLTTQPQDDKFWFKGVVNFIPEAPVYMGNKPVTIGDVVLFVQYSPTHYDIEHEGLKLKFIKTEDVLAVL